MAKETRASSVLGGEKKEKKQPKKGVEKRGKKAHAIHARRVENGFHSETKFKNDDGTEESQEHIHPSIEDLMNHMKSNMGEEQAEMQGGGEQPPAQAMPQEGM